MCIIYGSDPIVLLAFQMKFIFVSFEEAKLFMRSNIVLRQNNTEEREFFLFV
jgi:hypothetical protein